MTTFGFKKMINKNWDNGNWLGHCWLRLRRHMWSDWWWRVYLKTEVRVCEQCGRKQERKV
jgi:hypothetical protein